MRKSFIPQLLACFLVLCNSSFALALAISIPVGEKAPDFDLASVNSERTSLNEIRGSVIVLVYWKPDQDRSLMTMKDIQDIYGRYHAKGVKVVGISADAEEQNLLRQIIKNLKIEFPVLLDPERIFYGDYGVRVYPSTVIIDKEGIIAYDVPGHALTYKTKIEGTLRYMLDEITEKELAELFAPRAKIDKATLAADRRHNLALKFVESRMIEQAIDVAKMSIESNPDIAKSHILLGYLFLDNRDIDEAFEEFNTALQIAPESHDAKTGLGAALILKGDIDKAVEILTEATVSNPNPQMTYYELGKAYEQAGDKDRSIEMFKKVLGKIVEKYITPSSVSRCE